MQKYAQSMEKFVRNETNVIKTNSKQTNKKTQKKQTNKKIQKRKEKKAKTKTKTKQNIPPPKKTQSKTKQKNPNNVTLYSLKYSNASFFHYERIFDIHTVSCIAS